MGNKERKEKEKEIRREYILTSSENLFTKKGFYSTSMDEIAKECELAKGTLYLYFSSKEEILSSILSNKLSILHGMMITITGDETDPIERLRLSGNAVIEFYRKHPEYFRIVKEIKFPGETDSEIINEKFEVLNERIKNIWVFNMKIIKDGIDSGIFKKTTNPLEVAISLWAMSTAMIRTYDFTRLVIENGRQGTDARAFLDFDFLGLIYLNARRVIYSILVNPPSDFESLK